MKVFAAILILSLTGLTFSGLLLMSHSGHGDCGFKTGSVSTCPESYSSFGLAIHHSTSIKTLLFNFILILVLLLIISYRQTFSLPPGRQPWFCFTNQPEAEVQAKYRFWAWLANIAPLSARPNGRLV